MFKIIGLSRYSLGVPRPRSRLVVWFGADWFGGNKAQEVDCNALKINIENQGSYHD